MPRPALAELAALDDQHLVAGEQMLTTAASRAPVPEAARMMTSPSGADQLGEPRTHPAEQRLEGGRAVVEDRLRDRLEDLGRNRRRAGARRWYFFIGRLLGRASAYRGSDRAAGGCRAP
jgi:hypothetical protein